MRKKKKTFAVAGAFIKRDSEVWNFHHALEAYKTETKEEAISAFIADTLKEFPEHTLLERALVVEVKNV